MGLLTRQLGPVRLHLLRHVDAGDPDAWEGPDGIRPPSPEGHRQAERLAALLAGGGFAPDAIPPSPMTRARQTAETVGAALGRPIRIEPRLAGPLEPATVEAILADAGDPAQPVRMGHDPGFSALACELTGAAGAQLKRGRLARIHDDRPLKPSGTILRRLIPPGLRRSQPSRRPGPPPDVPGSRRCQRLQPVQAARA